MPNEGLLMGESFPTTVTVVAYLNPTTESFLGSVDLKVVTSNNVEYRPITCDNEREDP